jgi:hypothetical protein
VAAGSEVPRNDGGLGIVAVFERLIIEGWLEIEITAGWFNLGLQHVDNFAVPIELIFKKPFGHHSFFSPYIGLGASLAIERVACETEVTAGPAAVVGTHLWFRRTLGLDINCTYALLLRGALTHHLAIGLGPVWLFDI